MAGEMIASLARWGLGRLFPGVIMEVTSGLGNQLFQYALGRSLADDWGCDLALMPKDYSQDYIGRQYGLAAFAIRAKTLGYYARSVYADGAGWRGRIAGLAAGTGPVFLQEEHLTSIYNAIPAMRPPLMLSGYWQHEGYFRHNAARIKADLALRAPLPDYALRWLPILRQPNTVAVHVRRGDYAHHPHIQKVQGALPEAYYVEALAYVQARVPNAAYFVFSDEVAWVREQWSWPAGTVFIDTPPEAPAHVDLHLMHLCRHHIIANSTYSWWGAWLGERPDSLTVAPARWALSPAHDIPHIVPARWARL